MKPSGLADLVADGLLFEAGALGPVDDGVKLVGVLRTRSGRGQRPSRRGGRCRWAFLWFSSRPVPINPSDRLGGVVGLHVAEGWRQSSWMRWGRLLCRRSIALPVGRSRLAVVSRENFLYAEKREKDPTVTWDSMVSEHRPAHPPKVSPDEHISCYRSVAHPRTGGFSGW